MRARRFELQRVAARLVPAERVSKCRWTMQRQARGVGVMLGPDARAFFDGLQTCGSPWLCPCCSARISETRRGELNAALAWARAGGLVPVMLTLTHRHADGDDLAQQLARMKAAKKRLRQRREWRALAPVLTGTITATEVTHGAAGWHTHFHEVALVRAGDERAAVAAFAGLGAVWLACLRGVGLDGALPHAWQVQGAAAAGEYVGKWGAAEEVALGDRKRARKGGRSPWDLLAQAGEGAAGAGTLWREYAAAFKGARQLVWSPGLKARVGVDDRPDEAVAGDDAPEPERIAQIDGALWAGWPGVSGARNRRARVLDAAETGGAAAVAAVASDTREGPDGQVIEDTEGERSTRNAAPVNACGRGPRRARHERQREARTVRARGAGEGARDVSGWHRAEAREADGAAGVGDDDA